MGTGRCGSGDAIGGTCEPFASSLRVLRLGEDKDGLMEDGGVVELSAVPIVEED